MNSQVQAQIQPDNSQWQARKQNAIARGQGNANAIFIDKAVNAELWDIEGNRFIDFASGIAVNNTGHSHPQIQQAVCDQVARFSHSCVMVTPYDSAVRLAESLNLLAPGPSDKKSILLSTGAEAVENAIKVARAYTKRRGVVAFNGGFHGRTNLAMGLTGKVIPYKHCFGPFPGEIYHLPFPIAYHGISVEQSLEALDTLFKVDIASDDVAAIIIEPVQGEGGFYRAPVAFLQALRRICDERGILLITDEIQTGFARTGKMFCTEYAAIEPDLMTLAKGIAGGFPLSAVVGKANIMDAPMPGGLGGTYGGSPVACAAAIEVLDIIEREQLCDRATEVGEHFVRRLSQIQQHYPDVIGDIRQLGAMIAIELVKQGSANQPDVELTKALVAEAAKNGVIMLSCGFRNNVVRFLPALTIEKPLIDEGLTIVEHCLQALLLRR